MISKSMYIGRLTKDVELRYTNSNVAVANFTIAVERPYQQQGEKVVDFWNGVAWRALGENLSKYCKKGDLIYAEGHMENETYEDKEGNKRYKTIFVAAVIKFFPKPKERSITDFDKKEIHPQIEVDEDFLPF